MRSSSFLLAAALALPILTGCGRYANYTAYENAAAVTGGGDAKRGREVIRHYGCETCHTIPGVRDAVAVVGPPLNHLANRNVIAGELPNTAENLMKWIQKPRQILPHTAMPNMGVTDRDARDIVAYLYTLR